MRSPTSPSLRLAAAPALAFAFLLVYLATGQDDYWSDARFLLDLVERNEWRYHHVAYLPIAITLRAVAPAWLSTQGLLTTLSSVATAAGLGVVCHALLRSGTRPVVAVLTGGLLGLTPVVWFFATCVEVHALQFLVASVLVWLLTRRAVPSADDRVSLPLLAAVLVGLTATHMAGALWGPALGAYVLWRRRRGARLDGALPAGLLLAGFAALGLYVNAQLPAGSGHAGFALRSLIDRWHPALVWRELLRPQLGLFLLALVGGILRLRGSGQSAGARDDFARVTVAVALALVVFLPFCAVLDIRERGAYYLSLSPLLAYCAGRSLDRLGLVSASTVLATVAAASAVAGWLQLVAWREAYPGNEWAEPLIAEADADDLVFATSRREASAVFRHSRLSVFSPYTGAVPIDTGDPRLVELALAVASRRLDGGTIFVTRSFHESEDPGLRRILDGLRARFGAPQRRADGDYLVYHREGPRDERPAAGN